LLPSANNSDNNNNLRSCCFFAISNDVDHPLHGNAFAARAAPPPGDKRVRLTGRLTIPRRRPATITSIVATTTTTATATTTRPRLRQSPSTASRTRVSARIRGRFPARTPLSTRDVFPPYLGHKGISFSRTPVYPHIPQSLRAPAQV
jgi:hypothetical protein